MTAMLVTRSSSSPRSAMRPHVRHPVLAVVVAALLPPTGAIASASSPPENIRPGTTSWYIPKPSQGRIAAFAGAPSYLSGQTVHLFVDSRGQPFRYRVFRLGWYRGESGRLLASGHVARNPQQQRPRVFDDRPRGAKLFVPGWRASLALPVRASWPSGFYLVRLDLEAGRGSSYASFVVRDAQPGPIVLVLATNTWQAYNTWGGLSLYRDLRLRGPASRSQFDVAHTVTSRRPYVQGYGAGDFFRYDLSLVRWLERSGYPVSYATDRDVARGRAGGAGTRLLILSGHPEYHDLRERSTFQQLLRGGVSLAILGGNSFAWHARFNHHDQHMSVWRMRSLDPRRGRSATTRWIDIGWNPATLTSVHPVFGRAGSLRLEHRASWAWAGVSAQSKLGAVLGSEYDEVAPLALRRGVTVLASAPIANGPGTVDWTLAAHPGGAFVFSGSELGFSWRLEYPPLPSGRWIDAPSPAGSKRDYPAHSRVRAAVRRLVTNLIARATGLMPTHGGAANPGRSRP
jgi:hypothetical protein